MLDAVAFAHAHGIVHRDLKPENIMVGTFGEVFVMDWGVAQDSGLDADAAVVGTPGFMPPEQERAPEAVDGRADVYALGAILLQLVPDRRGPCARSPKRRGMPSQTIAIKPSRPWQRTWRVSAITSRSRRTANRWSNELLRFYRRYELPILLMLAYVVMRFVLLVWAGI